MFIIFGNSRRTKPFNVFMQDVCGQCHNPNNMQLVEISDWGTLFFIPIIKVTKQYFFVCPRCGAVCKVPKAEAKKLIAEAKNAQAQATAVNRNVRAEVAAPEVVAEPIAGAVATPTPEALSVETLIKNDIDRVMASIKDPAFLQDNSNFEKLYSSLKNGLTPKYNDAVLVEKVLKEYFNIV